MEFAAGVVFDQALLVGNPDVAISVDGHVLRVIKDFAVGVGISCAGGAKDQVGGGVIEAQHAAGLTFSDQQLAIWPKKQAARAVDVGNPSLDRLDGIGHFRYPQGLHVAIDQAGVSQAEGGLGFDPT